MSGMLLASACASRIPTANPDPDFKDVLPAPPTAIRDFPRGRHAGALHRGLRQPDEGGAPRRDQDDGDRGRWQGGATPQSDERKSEELQGAKGGLRLLDHDRNEGLAPGRYVLRVEADDAPDRRRQGRCASWSSGVR